MDRKYRDAWSGLLKVRFLIFTNELPRVTDASGALASRCILLPMNESFYGREDIDLTSKLMPECPGILNWALRGLQRLRERGHFIQPQSGTEELQQLEDLASTVGAFIRSWCVQGENKHISVEELYDAYCAWCEVMNFKKSNKIVFGRDLRSVLPKLRTSRKHGRTTYMGVTMSFKGTQRYEEVRDELRARRRSRMCDLQGLQGSSLFFKDFWEEHKKYRESKGILELEKNRDHPCNPCNPCRTTLIPVSHSYC